MKKILFILALFLLPSICLADEYVLVMSKEDNVCQHMLKIYNDDLRKHGKIKYDLHEEYKTIKWEERKYIWSFHASRNPGILMFARFDINNDGQEEIVLKQGDIGLKGRRSDNVYIFNKEDIETSRDEILITDDLMSKSVNILGGGLGKSESFKANVYKLNEIPALEIWEHQGKLTPVRYALGGWFYFHPFYYDGKYFISMNDWHPDMTETWEVILQVTSLNQLKDICYFLKVCECNGRTQRRK